MDGFACSRLRSSVAVVAFVSAVWLAGDEAQASTAVSVYAAVSRVEMLPTQATATEAVIHGAFMFLDSNARYSDAVCGFMYYRCPSGSESLCRMQWLDIQTMGTAAHQCAGFGNQHVVTSARVRTEGTALASPDLWDLGIGVQYGTHVDGKCALAKELACAQPGSWDGGVTDASIAADASQIVDATAEAGTRDSALAEAGGGARDSFAVDLTTRDLQSSPDQVPGDVRTADVASSLPDAGPDQRTTPAPDAPAISSDASTSDPSSDGDGCGCRLGRSPAKHGRGEFPVEWALLAAVAGIVAFRRVR